MNLNSVYFYQEVIVERKMKKTADHELDLDDLEPLEVNDSLNMLLKDD